MTTLLGGIRKTNRRKVKKKKNTIEESFAHNVKLNADVHYLVVKVTY